MTDFLVALGLMAVMEGVIYAAFPGPIKKAMHRLMEMPDNQLRLGGLVAMGVGLVIIWSVRSG